MYVVFKVEQGRFQQLRIAIELCSPAPREAQGTASHEGVNIVGLQRLAC